MRDADAADQAALTLPLEPAAGARARGRGCAPARSRFAPYQRSWRLELVAPLVGRRAQIFVATAARSRRPSSAAASERSAEPYIGDESTTRQPASSGGADDVACKPSSSSNVLPGAEADDRAEPALLDHARTRASSAGGERGREERRVLVRAAAHVLERQAGAHLLPVVHVHRARIVRRTFEPDRPGEVDLAQAEAEHRAGVVRQAAMPLPRVAFRDPRARPPGRRRARTRRSPPPLRRARRGPRREPVPTIPGPIAQTTASWPDALAQASADATSRRIATSPSRQGATATAVSTKPGLLQPAHRVRERHRQRTAAELDVGDSAPGRARRTPARPGCAASSRRPAGRRAAPRAAVLLDVPRRRAGRACTAA